MAERIVTEFWRKPGPANNFDWSATRDGYDGGFSDGRSDLIGYGPTEADAIADLLMQESER